MSSRLSHWLKTAFALFVINAALTLQNIWPTPWVRWDGALSVELAGLLLVLALLMSRSRRLPRGLPSLLTVLLLLLAIGRYAEVTAPALYGRPINLYWDLPHVANVVAMTTRSSSGWLLAAGCAAVVLLLVGLYVLLGVALRRIIAANESRLFRRCSASTALVLLCLAWLQTRNEHVPQLPAFEAPVVASYLTQFTRVAQSLSGSNAARALPASPDLSSRLGALAGSDVLLLFLESYGSSTYDRDAYSTALASSRAELAEAIERSGNHVVSAFVESPTFSGGSWLAHLSLLSGVEVRDPDRYDLLMTQKRPTLVSTFKAGGYRSIAVMPGLRQDWPEGGFYGFDDIYDAGRLDYRGPEFGWWRIPDQFTFARLRQQEMLRESRAPLFVVLPTINTHLPFTPVPPYQADWSRLLGSEPFEASQVRQTLTETPDWRDLGSSYMAALRYTFTLLGGFVQQPFPRPFVLVALGDHQPAANVSGQGASWDVPVHVITGNAKVLAALRQRGFTDGLEPRRSSLGHMNELTPLLLEAFSVE